MTRRLIVCSDGTWNTPEKQDRGVFAPSNVVKTARAILPEAPDGAPQVVFYDPGVGTGDLLDRYLGGAFGMGLSANVTDAYLYLVHNYADGDEIYFFGFSRGAYTVRSAAGLIRKCGLLYKRHADRVAEALEIYRQKDDTPDTARPTRFRETYSRHPLRIKFIGVWDTVGALGIPLDVLPLRRRGFEFHDVSLSRNVDYAYQALAIDEKRSFFRPTLWEQHREATGQKLEQAWFAGVHMDVGGGYNQSGLSNVAFRWMTEKAAATGLGFDEQYVAAQPPNHLADLHDSRSFPYNLFAPYSRPIGEIRNAEEAVHKSARERHRADTSYRPRNLVRYFERHGTP